MTAGPEKERQYHVQRRLSVAVQPVRIPAAPQQRLQCPGVFFRSRVHGIKERAGLSTTTLSLLK